MVELNEEILKKLTTKNIIALSTVGTLLWVVVTVFGSPDTFFLVVKTIQDADSVTAFAVGGIGGMVAGVFLAITKDVYQFFFRKKDNS